MHNVSYAAPSHSLRISQHRGLAFCWTSAFLEYAPWPMICFEAHPFIAPSSLLGMEPPCKKCTLEQINVELVQVSNHLKANIPKRTEAS